MRIPINYKASKKLSVFLFLEKSGHSVCVLKKGLLAISGRGVEKFPFADPFFLRHVFVRKLSSHKTVASFTEFSYLLVISKYLDGFSYVETCFGNALN